MATAAGTHVRWQLLEVGVLLLVVAFLVCCYLHVGHVLDIG
jgi:hypothetical protein